MSKEEDIELTIKKEGKVVYQGPPRRGGMEVGPKTNVKLSLGIIFVGLSFIVSTVYGTGVFLTKTDERIKSNEATTRALVPTVNTLLSMVADHERIVTKHGKDIDWLEDFARNSDAIHGQILDTAYYQGKPVDSHYSRAQMLRSMKDGINGGGS